MSDVIDLSAAARLRRPSRKIGPPARHAVAAALLLAAVACDGAMTLEPGNLADTAGTQPVYEFGARFEPPTGRVVHALGQWKEYNATYTAMVGQELSPVSELIFIDLGDTPRGWQPASIAALLQEHDARGVVPHVDLALRGLQVPKSVLDTIADPLFGIDDEIAHSTQYDARIQDMIQLVKAYGKPVMVRIGGEFSGSWNGYHPYDYPKAFRKIVGMFRAAGADNVAFIWCYEPAAAGDFGARDAAGNWKWFPGDDVVDWFGIDWFNTGDISDISTGRGGSSPYANTLAFLDMAVSHARPVIVAESSPARYDLSNPAEAQAAWAEWFVPYFQLIAEHPEIKWFHMISYDWTQAAHYAASGWKNNDITASPWLAEQYLAEISQPKYLHADERTLLNGFDAY